MKKAFANIIFKLQRNIEKTSTMEDVRNVLLTFDEKFDEMLSSCTSIAAVFSIIIPYISFFDFEIIKLLTSTLGSRSNKQKLKKYKKMFAEFLKQRICECPNDAFGDSEEAERSLVIKIDKKISELTNEKYQKFKSEVSRILKCTLRLLKVEDGCVELTFRALVSNQMLNNITTDQRNMLSKLQVICISYDEKNIITICNSSTKAKVLGT